MRLNPTHPNIDYVIYMRGLTNMASDDSALQGFFGVDRSDRDPQHARDAFNDFSKLVRGYPNSQYATDAYKRMVFLKIVWPNMSCRSWITTPIVAHGLPWLTVWKG